MSLIIRIQPTKKDHYQVAITGDHNSFNQELERSEIRQIIQKLDNKL